MELIFNNLEVVWFILITVLFAGFFLLEGFDYGTGILLPFIGKTDVERRQMINALGPVWDGNEVWMITAGGALFASFPHVYATLFSGFYLALFLMLAALIMRGVSFEFRSKSPNLLWRKTFDYCIFFGSLIPSTSPIRLQSRMQCVSVTIAGLPKTSPMIRLALLRPTPGSFKSASKVVGMLSSYCS